MRLLSGFRHKLRADGLQVEVIYAEPDRVVRCQFDVPEDSTVGDCVSIAAAQSQFATLDFAGCATGIFGEQCGVDRVVSDESAGAGSWGPGCRGCRDVRLVPREQHANRLGVLPSRRLHRRLRV